jgi:hypothetical protein
MTGGDPGPEVGLTLFFGVFGLATLMDADDDIRPGTSDRIRHGFLYFVFAGLVHAYTPMLV